MRLWIFLTATLLASVGFYLNLVEIGALFFERWWEGLLLLLSSAYAWTAYFKMGAAWIARKAVSRVWPITGTLAALLALNGGGSFFLLGTAYSPAVMLLQAIPVIPAVLMASWMAISQLRSANVQAPATRTPNVPNSH